MTTDRRTLAAYQRALEALTTAKTVSEARELYGCPGTDSLRRLSARFPDLQKMYRDLPHMSTLEWNEAATKRAYQRTKKALWSAETLPEARRLSGYSGKGTLRKVALKYPELRERYQELVYRSSPSAHRENLIEDIMFLASSGEAYTQVARNLGKSIAALEKILYRANRPDLLAQLKKNERGF